MSLASQVITSHKVHKEHQAKVIAESAGMPAKFEIAMSKIDMKPVQKQVEIYKYILRNLAERMADKPANSMELKAWASHFLSSIQKGVDGESDAVEMEEAEEVESEDSMFDDEKVGDLVATYLEKLSRKPVNSRVEKLEAQFKAAVSELSAMSSGDRKAKNLLRLAIKGINESMGLAKRVLEDYSGNARLPRRSSISERDGLGNSRIKLLRKEGNKLYYHLPKSNQNLVYVANIEPSMKDVNLFRNKPDDLVGTTVKIPLLGTSGSNSYVHKIVGYEGDKIKLQIDKDTVVLTPEEIAILMTIRTAVQRKTGTDDIANSNKTIALARSIGAADIVAGKKSYNDLMSSLFGK